MASRNAVHERILEIFLEHYLEEVEVEVLTDMTRSVYSEFTLFRDEDALIDQSTPPRPTVRVSSCFVSCV